MDIALIIVCLSLIISIIIDIKIIKLNREISILEKDMLEQLDEINNNCDSNSDEKVK